MAALLDRTVKEAINQIKVLSQRHHSGKNCLEYIQDVTAYMTACCTSLSLLEMSQCFLCNVFFWSSCRGVIGNTFPTCQPDFANIEGDACKLIAYSGPWLEPNEK